MQLLRAKVGIVHAVLYTHYHADHLYRPRRPAAHAAPLGGPCRSTAPTEVERKIRQSFSYAFVPNAESVPSGSAEAEFRFDHRRSPFTVLGESITPIPLIHAHFNVLGFRIGDVAYCTDVNKIPKESWPRLEGLDVLVLDAAALQAAPGTLLRRGSARGDRPRAARRRRTSPTSRTTSTTKPPTETLPPNVELAYDGLRFEF